jgi:hypothetical protein
LLHAEDIHHWSSVITRELQRGVEIARGEHSPRACGVDYESDVDRDQATGQPAPGLSAAAIDERCLDHRPVYRDA